MCVVAFGYSGKALQVVVKAYGVTVATGCVCHGVYRAVAGTCQVCDVFCAASTWLLASVGVVQPTPEFEFVPAGCHSWCVCQQNCACVGVLDVVNACSAVQSQFG